MPLIGKISEEWKDFGLGALFGGVVTYGGPKLFHKFGDYMGNKIAVKVRTPDIGYESNAAKDPYTAIISILKRIEQRQTEADQRLSQVETTVYKGKGG